MVYSARALSLLLAFRIALITVLFLSLVEEVSKSGMLVTFAISFSVSYLLTFVILEFLIFKEIDKIHKLLHKLKKKDLKSISNQYPGALNPLKSINDDIFTLAEIKQQEIDDLKKLEAFRKEFIANVSHELKRPIFAAQGFVQSRHARLHHSSPIDLCQLPEAICGIWFQLSEKRSSRLRRFLFQKTGPPLAGPAVRTGSPT